MARPTPASEPLVMPSSAQAFRTQADWAEPDGALGSAATPAANDLSASPGSASRKPVPAPPSSGVRAAERTGSSQRPAAGPSQHPAAGPSKRPTGSSPALRLVASLQTPAASALDFALNDAKAESTATPASTMSPENPRPTNLRAVNDPGPRPTSAAPQCDVGAPPPAPQRDSRGSPSAAPTHLTLVAADTDVLVARAGRGDRWAFNELFRRHRSDVARLVYRMMGPSADLEDICQEVFLQVHRSIGEFRGQAKFSTWLHRVTVNVVLMTRRAARSRPVLTGETPTEYEPDSGLAPDEDAMRKRRIEAFRRLLDRLPEKKRTVFEMHELDGCTPAEIAEHVNAPVLTVRTRLFYARRELEEMIREEPALSQLADELAKENAANPAQYSAQSSETGTAAGKSRDEEAT